MTKLSKYFNLGKTQSELDFVDIAPEQDIPLFIDPYALSVKTDIWSQECNNYIVSFFQTALDYIRSNQVGDAKQLLNNLNEPNETCLGLSKKNPQGRGVSGKQALDLYNKLAESQAAKSGLLSELAECDLFVEGIGHDKISDITTNIIRKLLVEYTQAQCTLHSIEIKGTVSSGKLWDIDKKIWYQEHVKLPVIDDKKILLVPKSIVRIASSVDSHEFYNHFVLNFIQQENLNSNSSLVKVLKNGARKVYKKDIKKEYPFNKNWLASFSRENPSVLFDYKNAVKDKILTSNDTDTFNQLDDDFNETIFADTLINSLKRIEAGNQMASQYHSLMIGILEFIFWPNLINPKKEHEIHEGRKRIDIIYTNAARGGFFYRVHTAHNIVSNLIMVECKNYNHEIKNPELDQISGRFSINRGKLGFLLYRQTENYNQLLKKCKDTATDGRGFIIPLGDEQVFDLLGFIKNKKRDDIDNYLDNILLKIM